MSVLFYRRFGVLEDGTAGEAVYGRLQWLTLVYGCLEEERIRLNPTGSDLREARAEGWRWRDRGANPTESDQIQVFFTGDLEGGKGRAHLSDQGGHLGRPRLVKV
ncbi:hypothetical protein BGE01nite_33650 [Brevifollis gellanilyticus]|uniref:Uncharacterized protein n=1 Tax=Brevifollis gellanilyticus TaxID=748831 RepID=A0A512MBH1_9BACT|nr:hypothetical protein BGE01nite_33650 [Brevifollis gellanilyticus]